MPINTWLDADPGHDDAIALLLALYLPEIHLVGLSTVHGNGSLDRTTINAAQLLASFVAPARAATISLHAGARQPLIRPVKHDPEIHGESGLDGVEGLVSEAHPVVQQLVSQSTALPAVAAIAQACRSLGQGETLQIVATGTLTNVALFVASYPDLVRDKVEQIVLMGGAEGRGNRSPTGEFNIICDPEAASIVLNAEVKVVMIPLNVTHTALFTPQEDALLKRSPPDSTSALTPLRHTLSTLLNFFARAYAEVFGFDAGPPVHDALCMAFVAHPEMFKGTRHRVDVELAGQYTAGTTSVDLWGYRNAGLTAMHNPSSRASWGREGKNVWVCEQVDVAAFWTLFHHVVDCADAESPLNV